MSCIINTFKHNAPRNTEVTTGANISNSDVFKMGRALCQVCHVRSW